MAIQHEEAFETEICEYLAAHGWEYSPDDPGYDRDRALFPADVFAWLQATQPEQLDKLVKPGASTASRDLGRKQILDRIVAVQTTDTMNGGGTLNALKGSIGVLNAKFSRFQARPATSLNAKLVERFAFNRVRVMRQVVYSGRNANRLDLVVFVNGIPVGTVELKTCAGCGCTRRTSRRRSSPGRAKRPCATSSPSTRTWKSTSSMGRWRRWSRSRVR